MMRGSRGPAGPGGGAGQRLAEGGFQFGHPGDRKRRPGGGSLYAGGVGSGHRSLPFGGGGGLLPGTRQVQAHIHGPTTHPQARIDLTLNPSSTPEHLLKDVHDAVERAHRSAGWDELPTHIHLDVARHGPHRAE